MQQAVRTLQAHLAAAQLHVEESVGIQNDILLQVSHSVSQHDYVECFVQ